MRAVIKGTLEGSEESWDEAVSATPFTDGANLEAVSPAQVRPLSSTFWSEFDAPQFKRISVEAVESLPAATASDTRANSVRVTGCTENAIAAVGVPRVRDEQSDDSVTSTCYKMAS
jgi:hypothetical protein